MTLDRTVPHAPVVRQWRWVLALVGPPGSGKGTQASWLTSALELTALSTGELARSAARQQNKRGRVINRYINSGALLPDSIVLDLVQDAITTAPTSSRGLLFDGFPRTDTQALALETLLERPLDVFIELRVDDEVILERLANRGRHDDQELAVLRRLDEFDRSTRPMIERIRADGRVLSIDGAQPPAVVHRAITDALGRYRRQHNAPNITA